MKKLLLILALLSSPAWAAIARVATTPAGVVHTTAATTCANAQTAGFGTSTTHTIVVVVGMQPGASPTVTVADNATGGTNTYTRLGTGVDTASGHVELWYAVNIPRVNASGLVVTVTMPSQRHTCEVKAYTGVVSAGAAITSTNSGSSAATGTISTATSSPNSWIIAGIAAGNGSTTVGASTGTLDNSAASTGSTTPSSGLVSNTSVTQGNTVTDAVAWGTNRAWVAGAIELRSDLANPTMSPNGGGFNNDTAWTISDADAGVTVCWRTDGTSPAATTPGTCDASNNTTTSGTVTATGTTFKILVTKIGWTNSAVFTGTAFTLTVAAPAFGTNGGSFNNDTASTQTSTTTGAVFCQTVNGTTPAAATPGTCSAGTTGASITVIATGSAINALGTKVNYVNSAVQTSSAFTLTVGAASCSPAGGSFSGTQSVTCSIATTTGATTKYCQDSPGTCTPTTTYSGAVSQTSTGHFRVQGSKTNYVSDSVVDYSFTIGSPAVSLSVASHDFGHQTNLTTSAAFAITLTNTGSATLNITNSNAIGGTNAGDFAVSGNTCGSTLGASANCVVSVTFNPGSQGARSGTLTFITDASTSPDVVTLAGTGDWPASSQCTVAVTFTPAISAARSGTLTLANDASDSPQVVTLTGTGSGPPSTLGTLTVDFPSISPGRSATLSWTASGDVNLACSIDQGVGSLVISDPNGSSGTKTVSPTAAGNITYTMTCTSATGSVAPTATVFVTRPVAIGP